MRSTLAVLIFLTHTAASAQMQWTHEVLFDDVTYLEGQFADAMVSDDGIPLYRAARRSAPYLHTYYYRTNLNALYFSVPSVGGPGVIGRSGKVAFLARTATTYHVIGDGRDYFAEVEAPSLEGYVQLTDVDSAGRPVWSRTFTQWQDRFYYGSRPIGVGLPLDNKSGKVAPNGDLIWGGGVACRRSVGLCEPSLRQRHEALPTHPRDQRLREQCGHQRQWNGCVERVR